MSETPHRRERQDAVKNRGHILAVAQELFDRLGVENVSMNGIAQEAGVGAGTLYRHFNSKSDLCFALIQDQLFTLASQLDALVDASDDPRATLADMILRHQRFKERREPLFEGMQLALPGRTGAMQSPVYEALRRPFARVFEQAARADNATQPVDAVLRADVLLSTLIGSADKHQRASHGLTREDYAQAMCEIFYPRA